MSEQGTTRDETKRPPEPGFLGKVSGILTSLRFAVAIVVLLAIACVLGTLLPQGTAVQRYLQAHPEAEGRMELLGFLGLTHVYSAWWFIGLLGLLAASLGLCTVRRGRTAHQARGRARGRAIGSVLTHISMLLIFAGGVIRGAVGKKGQIAFWEGQTAEHFLIDGLPEELPFSVHLAKFEIEMYEDPEAAGPQIHSEQLEVIWPAMNVRTALPVALDEEQWVLPEGEQPGSASALRVRVLHRVLDFAVDTETRDVLSRSDQPNNPAVQVEMLHASVTNTTWLFARYPDFNMHAEKRLPYQVVYAVQVQDAQPPQVKDYKSSLQILEDSRVVKEKTIEVNSPLSHKGYRLYQSGYNPQDPKWTSLLVVRDPGVPLVYTGFALMVVGLVVVFYIYPTGPAIRSSARSKEKAPHDNGI
jgi:hypothetical protein